MKISTPALLCTLLASSAAAQLTLKPGWPITVPSPSVDGGLMIDLDGDPELELMHVAGDTVYAWNPDGSTVLGWPRFAGDGTFAPPAAGDLDGDGEPEIVLHTFFFGIGGQIAAYHRDGSTVAGFPVAFGGTVKAPALGDLDGDGDVEIVSVQNVGGFGQVYALDGDGSVMTGWSQGLDDVGGSGPAVADLDGDGTSEIVALSFQSVFAYNADGTLLPGFPFTLSAPQSFNYTTPTLADLDGDGVKEIITATGNQSGGPSRVYALRADGTLFPGWPQTTTYPVFAPPCVADIDGDSTFEVIAGDVTLSPIPVNKVYVWEADGTPQAGFPVGPINAIHAQISVVDIDGDSDLELICDDNVAVGNHVAFHHDGSQVAGFAPLTMGGAFQQSPSIGDVDGDGLFELSISANDQINGLTHVYLYDLPTTALPRLAPVATYQYRGERDGLGLPASFIFPLGCGVNPFGSLVLESGVPELGTTIELGVDNPLGTQPAGSVALLALSTEPAGAAPCGVTLPGIGMVGPYADGELLISISAPNPIVVLGPQLWSGAGSPASFPIPIPPTPALGGEHIFVQGLMLDTTAGAFAVTEGLELRVGI